MKPLNIDLQHIPKEYLSNYRDMMGKVIEAHAKIINKNGAGNDFLGWVDHPSRFLESDELKRILATSQRLREQSDVVLIIGIGGSYLGSKALIDALSPYFGRKQPEIIFVGHHLSGQYIYELMNYLENIDFSINVISKSGTTTEPAIAFRFFKDMLEKRYGKEGASKRIVATTDARRGALRNLADIEGYETYEIDDDIGGRYSVFTPVGLLPIALAGIDIEAIISGAFTAMIELKNPADNPLLEYVVARNLLYEKGKKIEMLIHYEAAMATVAEWWKQLFGESEGKDKKGIFVSSAQFTTDLHSLGQYIQEGERHIFETVVYFKNTGNDLTIKEDQDNLDELNYLMGKTVDSVNHQAMIATHLAHIDGDVPNIVIEIKTRDAFHLGYLLYFYQFSCALSGYVLGVNPFDQPGVEAYKKNMFALLDKPGYEAMSAAIKTRLKK